MDSAGAPTADFAAWAGADRIVATTNLNLPRQTVTDAARIRALLAALEPYTSGWDVPEAGVPVAALRLNFYQGERLLGHVGLGETFLVLHQRGGFWSQPVAPQVTEELRALFTGRTERPWPGLP
jgi:hypothetical protein